MNTIHERRTPEMSTWLGRKRGSEKCRNSFAHFVSEAKRSKAGKAHLERHHGGYGL